MPISSNEYVEITSIAGGASATSARTLQLRLITTNELVPTNTTVSFVDSATVLDYFGSSTSLEYLQSNQYFSHIDKLGRRPNSIQFTRWADTDTSAQVFGGKLATLTELQTVTSGAFDVVFGGSTFNITALDFSSALSYADIASDLETAIQALDASLSLTTVTYDSSRTGFNLDTNSVADGAISFIEVTAGLLDSLGWNQDISVIYSSGISAQTLTEMMTKSTENNNNFGSFCTVDQVTLSQTEELAEFNNSRNVEFQYYPRCELSQASTFSSALISYAGTGLVGFDVSKTTEFPWIHPAAELAAINWDEPAASKNFSNTQNSAISALVTNTSDKKTYDSLRLNYFGNTQNAGDILTFFQNGILMGGESAPLQMGVYAGEQWLKSEATAQFLNMLLALPIISADEQGEAQAITYITDFNFKAKQNGVISVGKQLNTTQKSYITQITGDSNAWQTVQRDGSWYNTFVSEETSGGVTSYTMNYNFIYAKRDGVGKVEGRHVLI